MKKAKVFAMIKDKDLLILEIEKSENSLRTIKNFLVDIEFSTLEACKVLSRLGDSDNNYSARKYKNALYQDLFIRTFL